VKPDLSASETKTIVISESSVDSSSEANSLVSFATAEIAGEKNQRTRQNHGES
jgi:hypothetical protein